MAERSPRLPARGRDGASGRPRARPACLRAPTTSVSSSTSTFGSARDAVDEVARHAGVEARAAHDQPHLRDLARQVHHGLTGGVAGADQRHLLAGAELRLERRGPVVDARAFEVVEVREVEAAVAGAARDHRRRARAHPLLRGEIATETARRRGRSEHSQAHDLVRDRHLGAELLRLIEGARHERHAADPGRKAEVVLDPRRRARLAAERARVEHDDREPFGGGVDGGGETRGSGADDRDVVDLARVDRADEPDAARELALARVPQQRVRRRRARSAAPTARRGTGRARCERSRRSSGSSVTCGWPFRARNPASRITSPSFGVPDDHGSGAGAFEEADAAEDERAHDALAELGLRDQDVAAAARKG